MNHPIPVVVAFLLLGCVPKLPVQVLRAPSGVRTEALHHLLAHARKERSTALHVTVDGAVVVQAGADDPVMAMSASKSVASLAVGLLVDDGRMRLDDPVSTWVSEWSEGDKGAVTVRHLLNHTSGMDGARADFQAEGIAEHAIGPELRFSPGRVFAYNNNAVDFLAVVVERAAGRSMAALLEERLFEPMGIEAEWRLDVAGVPRAAGELMIRPSDLAKIGQLMLDGGLWEGRQLVSRQWIVESVTTSQEHNPRCGLLWWRDGEVAVFRFDEDALDGWTAAGIDQELVEAARGLVPSEEAGEGMASLRRAAGARPVEALFERALAGDIRLGRWETVSPPWGFSAQGWLGQYLVVIPEYRVVAVRMRAATVRDYLVPGETDGYRDFLVDVRALVVEGGHDY